MTAEEQAIEKAAAEAQQAEALAIQNTPRRFVVLRPVLHGTQGLATGTVLLFTAAQAKGLLEDGAIAPEPVASQAAGVVDLTPVPAKDKKK